MVVCMSGGVYEWRCAYFYTEAILTSEVLY